MLLKNIQSKKEIYKTNNLEISSKQDVHQYHHLELNTILRKFSELLTISFASFTFHINVTKSVHQA